MVRISSQQIFSGGINRMQDINSDLVKTQQQISTGKKVNKPSDDPVAAARILKLDQNLSRLETYQRNADLADNRLKQEESALSSAIDIIQRVRELTVQAGNGSLSANDRKSISSELKERLGQLADVANTRDASGEYIFSGFQGNSPAFVKENGSWTYNGDEGQRVLEIDDGVTVPISDHGKGIFGDVPAEVFVKSATQEDGFITGLEVVDPKSLAAVFDPKVPDDLRITINEPSPGVYEIEGIYDDRNTPPVNLVTSPIPFQGGEELEFAGIKFTLNDVADNKSFTIGINDKQSIFGTIETLIAGLDNISKDSPKGNAEYDALISESLANLDNGQESILLKQTEIGGRMNAVESTSAFLDDSALYAKEIRSQLQDVDYAEAISNLSFQSFVLQAAQQSFAQISRLSLFDRL
ncbi:flagellar hook-associated protein FlgL [Marinobacter litoralis]|uniref:flagellar hook-associated protein FlgL n=1 Tax=Marinobacter litoralis TaxID=187981 RepID=UPI0018EC2932|nr:flagellar hook-associated protein FlgL [Marinobacter litoralis]MBJ6138064.1 flagellar hook-associated protein FlgL [Marinobacter litoralis]